MPWLESSRSSDDLSAYQTFCVHGGSGSSGSGDLALVLTTPTKRSGGTDSKGSAVLAERKDSVKVTLSRATNAGAGSH